MPTDTYKLSYKYDKDGKTPSQDVKEIKEVGKYNVTVADASADDNFAISGVPLGNEFTVTAEKDFVDVPNTQVVLPVREERQQGWLHDRYRRHEALRSERGNFSRHGGHCPFSHG